MFNKKILLSFSLVFLSSHTFASNFVINELVYNAGDDLGKDPDGFIRIGSDGASSIVTVSHANDAAGASGQAIIGLALDNETFLGATLSDRTLTNEYDGLRFTPGATNVPVPAAAWLLGSALMSLAGIRRIRK